MKFYVENKKLKKKKKRSVCIIEKCVKFTYLSPISTYISQIYSLLIEKYLHGSYSHANLFFNTSLFIYIYIYIYREREREREREGK